MLVHDLARTENRFTALRQYCENEARIDPADFHCINYDFCNATLTNPLDAGNKGGLAFVGEQYDIRVRTDDFRLMFVGYDYGTGCSGLVDRRRDIQEYHPRLNPHYKGIVKMLLEIYQESCPSEAETG
ncbi:MAG: hypothetical protein ACJ73N_06835, partial [Bryobacteraceae bacterium]